MNEPQPIRVGPEARISSLQQALTDATLQLADLRAVVMVLEDSLEAARERVAIMEVEADPVAEDANLT